MFKFSEQIQFKYSFPSTSQNHKWEYNTKTETTFLSFPRNVQWVKRNKQWSPHVSSRIFQRGAWVHTLRPTWSVNLTIPGRLQFTVHALTVQALSERQVGRFLETQASLHLSSADAISRISRCPGDHLDLLLFPDCQMSRNPEQMRLSHLISCRQNF